jgi:hypothetical protein
MFSVRVLSGQTGAEHVMQLAGRGQPSGGGGGKGCRRRTGGGKGGARRAGQEHARVEKERIKTEAEGRGKSTHDPGVGRD